MRAERLRGARRPGCGLACAGLCRMIAACKAPQKGVVMKTPRLALRRLMSGLAVMAAGALLPPAFGSTTYYVNGDCGSNAWTGTSSVCTAPNGPKRTIQAGIDASIDGDEVIVADGVYTGSGNKGLDFEGRLITLRSANGPDSCVINCLGSGRAFYFHSGETLDAVIQGFTITNGSDYYGGAMLLDPADVTIIDCVFTNNTGFIGSAIHQRNGRNLVLERCTFAGNTATNAGGAVFTFSAEDGSAERFLALDCVFTDNNGGLGPGAVGVVYPETAFTNCFFAENVATFVCGGIADGSGYSTLINCVLSRNEASESGGANFGNFETAVINCTVTGNLGGGIGAGGTAESVTASNCILWGNNPWQFNHPGVAVVHSDVEGGWPGIGNIDADPLFVQPGTDNVRLSIGSPCVNAGDNDAVPPGIVADIDGNPRIQGGVVDMGAYEGEFDAEAAADGESDFDNGEFVILVPTGGPMDPMQNAVVFVVNTSGPDDATFVVTEYEADVYPDAAGYSELSCILSLDTSLADGEYLATLFIPFDAAGLGPINPAQVNLTRYDPEAGNWSLVVTGNASNSPGYDGPVGDRVLSLEGGAWSVTSEIGDYGVYWDPALQQGFAWAHVDVAQDFGLGVAMCPADCLQTPDGEVSIVDFLALLRRWGESSVGSPCDIDGDGVIGQEDFLALLEVWGTCPPEPMPAARPPARSGARAEFEALRASWGPCEGCPADLNGDGVVGVRDYLSMLASWPPE
jgi:hypothetical protein